jgi:amino acid adenylation domain-containing protein
LLSRYSGEPEVLFGTTVAGRPAGLRGVEQMVGMFINTLPMRVRIDETEQVNEWLQRLQAEAVEMRQYEYSPLVEVAKWSEMPRGTPLFESVLVFENYPANNNGSERNGKNGIPTIEDVSYYWRANYPLTIIVAPRNELKWTFSYEADLFDDETIRRMMGHFRQLLRGIATEPQQRICDLSLLTDEERQQLLAEFNDTKTEFPQELCLHQLFEQQVARNPEQVAVVFGEEKVSYRELNERANQLSHRLHRLGVGPEVLVGVLLERSVEMVVALLGILKAGGAYLPLDPAYPLDRLSFMMADAGATVLLTQNSLRGTLPQSQATVVRLDTEWDNIAKESTENPAAVLNVSNLAYVIYTSGSTGRPKGVMVTHANVSRLFTATEELFRFDEQDVWTLFHSYAFDFSVWELWGALLYGGRLVVVPYWVSRTPQAFYELLIQERVTVLNQTPSAFRQLLVAEQDRAPLDSLRYVIFGGEALELSSLREWFARHGEEQPQMINMYGITETTVHVTYRRIREKDLEGRNTSPIGHGLKDLEES